MKILLINANPVVSRLLSLCTRDTHLLLDEVAGVDKVKDVGYDLVFVDDGSYSDKIDSFLEEGNSRKKIFISYVKEVVEGFDETIQKPFLPSQIIKVIESVDSYETVNSDLGTHSIFPLASEKESVIKEEELSIFPLEEMNESSEEIFAFQDELEREEEEEESPEEYPLAVLDSREIDKIKALLEMEEEEIEAIDSLSEDEVHFRKVKVIKEQLISEGLEILDENEIINVLSTRKKERKAVKCKKNKLKHQKEQQQKQSMLECTKEELDQLETAVAKALRNLKPAKMQKFLEGNEVKLKIKLEDNN
jgi:ribosomal protein L21